MSIRFFGADPYSTIADAQRLTDDLDLLVGHGRPTDADLAGAPVIDLWRPAIRQCSTLIGLVTGHPLIGNGRPTLTSHLFAIDAEAGWARTWSRYYRLGRSVDLQDGRPQ
jgi:hypothetical protein